MVCEGSEWRAEVSVGLKAKALEERIHMRYGKPLHHKIKISVEFCSKVDINHLPTDEVN